MKKLKEIRIKELEKTILLVDIILYLLIVFIGYCCLQVVNSTKIDTIVFNETLYFVLAFVYILAYVVNRRKNNYEYLIQGFICTYTVTYLFINENNLSITSVFGTTLLIYSISYMINKIYNGYKLYKIKKINYISKFSIGIVIGIVGIYLSTLAYKSASIISHINGYYFILYGLINLLEPFMEIVLNSSYISNKLNILFKYEKKEKKDPETQKRKKVRELKSTRIKKK